MLLLLTNLAQMRLMAQNQNWFSDTSSLSDVGVSASGTAYGFSYSASYDWQFSDGIFAGIAYPTFSEDGGAEELLLGYGSLSYDKISGSGL